MRLSLLIVPGVNKGRRRASHEVLGRVIVCRLAARNEGARPRRMSKKGRRSRGVRKRRRRDVVVGSSSQCEYARNGGRTLFAGTRPPHDALFLDCVSGLLAVRYVSPRLRPCSNGRYRASSVTTQSIYLLLLTAVHPSCTLVGLFDRLFTSRSWIKRTNTRCYAGEPHVILRSGELGSACHVLKTAF